MLHRTQAVYCVAPVGARDTPERATQTLTGSGGVQLETIGDAFMCAGGVPDAMTPAQGACAAADMALDMIEVSAGVC